MTVDLPYRIKRAVALSSFKARHYVNSALPEARDPLQRCVIDHERTKLPFDVLLNTPAMLLNIAKHAVANYVII